MTATVLFFGDRSQPALERLYTHLQARGKRRVVHFTVQPFPPLLLPAGPQDGPGRIADVPFEDVVGVYADGLYVPPEPHLKAADSEFAQTEAWAALIALFGRLSRTATVANFITRREVVQSRVALMGFLAAQGLPVPRMLVTSDPEAARAFYESLDGRVQSRTVAHPYAELHDVGEDDLARIDSVRLAPVHFEEVIDGMWQVAAAVGDTAPGIPEALRQPCIETCRRLSLEMAEVVLCRTDAGWRISDLRTHLTLETLQHKSVLAAATTRLER